MKVALVCDTMSAFGGAERVIQQILRIYPNADLFSVLDAVPQNQREFLEGRKITSSFLQGLPFVRRYYRHLLHLWPLAVEQLDVTDYDLVLSSHHSVAYGVLTRPDQTHISYVHSPMRYAWDLQHQYLRQARLRFGPLGLLSRNILHKARIWDYAAAQRPDCIVTNSHFVAERMRRIHRREATVIFPPVAVEQRRPRTVSGGDTYVTIGRLVPYKRTDLLVRAFAQMPHRRLKVVGEGPEARRLAAMAPPNVEILGYQPHAVVQELLGSARAYLFAGIEDFGITPVEAQASGVPVIAYRGGGLMETVIGLGQPNPTGVFFDSQTEASFIAAVGQFEANEHLITPGNCVANAARFAEQRFRDEFSALVDTVLEAPRSSWLARDQSPRLRTPSPSEPRRETMLVPPIRSVARQEA